MLDEVAGTGTVFLAALVVGVSAAVLLRKGRLDGEDKINMTVNTAELRRKRVAMLCPQVCWHAMAVLFQC